MLKYLISNFFEVILYELGSDLVMEKISFFWEGIHYFALIIKWEIGNL